MVFHFLHFSSFFFSWSNGQGRPVAKENGLLKPLRAGQGNSQRTGDDLYTSGCSDTKTLRPKCHAELLPGTVGLWDEQEAKVHWVTQTASTQPPIWYLFKGLNPYM